MSLGPLTVAEAIDFWDRRHVVRDDFSSGGDVSFDQASNELFYSLRLGLLLQVLGDATSRTERRRLLDAGCGKGWFSRSMSRFGYRVEGIDTSPSAIRRCAELSDAESYAVSTLSGWVPEGLYDDVVSVDVLFHLLDEQEWSRSVANLARCVRLGGRLVLSDWDRDVEQVFGRHQRCRPPARYQELLTPAGMRYDGFVPYGYRDSRVGLHAWTRAS